MRQLITESIAVMMMLMMMMMMMMTVIWPKKFGKDGIEPPSPCRRDGDPNLIQSFFGSPGVYIPSSTSIRSAVFAVPGRVA